LKNTPITAQALFYKKWEFPCADSAVLTVFETLKNIDFQGGIPTFKYETKMRQMTVKGDSQRKIAKCIRHVVVQCCKIACSNVLLEIVCVCLLQNKPCVQHVLFF